MADRTDDVPEPERYPPPATRSPAVKWLIVAVYTAAIAVLMGWWLYHEVR